MLLKWEKYWKNMKDLLFYRQKIEKKINFVENRILIYLY